MLYRDFVVDSSATVEAIDRELIMPLTAEGRSCMQAHIAAHPRTERPTHRYNTGSSAHINAERASFARYQCYFGVPSEL